MFDIKFLHEGRHPRKRPSLIFLTLATTAADPTAFSINILTIVSVCWRYLFADFLSLLYIFKLVILFIKEAYCACLFSVVAGCLFELL